MNVIPWVAAWSAEQHYWVSALSNGKPARMQLERQGEGVPLPSFRHIARLRRIFEEQLCSVCGERLDDYSFIFPYGELKNGTFYFSDTPLHRVCAERALHLCPHLKALGWAPIVVPELLESRVTYSMLDGVQVMEGYLYCMDASAYGRWRHG